MTNDSSHRSDLVLACSCSRWNMMMAMAQLNTHYNYTFCYWDESQWHWYRFDHVTATVINQSPSTPPPACLAHGNCTAATLAFVTGQQYASADCSGDPIFEWDTTPIATSYATSSDVCVPIDGGSTSIRNEWCDFSGDVPRLHGTVYPGVSDCSGSGLECCAARACGPSLP